MLSGVAQQFVHILWCTEPCFSYPLSRLRTKRRLAGDPAVMCSRHRRESAHDPCDFHHHHHHQQQQQQHVTAGSGEGATGLGRAELGRVGLRWPDPVSGWTRPGAELGFGFKTLFIRESFIFFITLWNLFIPFKMKFSRQGVSFCERSRVFRASAKRAR